MEEKDSDYFFGRDAGDVETLEALAAEDRLPLLIGNSGVGKSSLAQAGVLAALKRQAWPDEASAADAMAAGLAGQPAMVLSDAEARRRADQGAGRMLSRGLEFEAGDPKRVERQLWIKLLQGKATVAHLIDATERRREELDQPRPPAFFLYIDQGEELYAAPGEREDRGRKSGSVSPNSLPRRSPTRACA